MSQVVELLQSLVRIPSVNPEGDPGTEYVGEEGMARWLAGWLGAEFPDARVELREVLPGRPNVVARFGPATGKPRLLFAPHTDTVSVAGMTIEPFGGEVRDGRVWGRGASDTKGSMAAMLAALHARRGMLHALSHEVWFAGLMGEEAFQHGSKTLAREERFDLVLVGEPTGMDVVYKHKGSAFLNLRTRGVAAHGARPELGDNAIEKMLRVLAWVRDVLQPEFAGHRDEVLGAATVNIGTIRGGSKTNIVPDLCEASVDLRLVPAQFTGDFAARLEGRLREVCADIEVDMDPAPPLDTDPAHPVIGQLLACGAQLVGAPWFCDACFFAQAGTPAIAIGPGSIAQAHTRDEWIRVADLEGGAEFFTRFLDRLVPR